MENKVFSGLKKKDKSAKQKKKIKLSFPVCLVMSIIGFAMVGSMGMLSEDLDFSLVLLYGIIAAVLGLMAPVYFFYIIYRIFWGDPKKDKERKAQLRMAAREHLKGIAVFEDGTLKLFARSAQLANIIDIVGAQTIATYKNPEEIHFGAATVGGVTTGGVYTTGGELYDEVASVSGHYHMKYDGNIIYQILLTEDLATQARASEIMNYCEKDAIIVYKQPVLTDAAMIRAKVGNLNQVNYELTMGHPSKEKADAILKWISEEK